jgi:hypothetical protein
MKAYLCLANAQTIVANPGALVSVQAFLWVPIILVLILITMVCFMGQMDADKSRDTILYAKFISNVKDK